MPTKKPTKKLTPTNPADAIRAFSPVEIIAEARRRNLDVRSLHSLHREDRRIVTAYLTGLSRGRVCQVEFTLNDVHGALDHLHGEDDDVPF